MKKFKIVCICQVYNELEKENLKRFFKYIKPLVDDIVIYDDCSTDGSYEYSLQQTKHVIRGIKNDFTDERTHRQKMLEEALKLDPDFILWLDADEVLTKGAKEKLQDLCELCEKRNLDGISLHELNLWRSTTWRRVDSLYNDGWFTRLWKVKPGISFAEVKKGLHQTQVPLTIEKVRKSKELSVLHFGFSSKKSLAYKYLTYRSHGQRGYTMLDRLINEDSLKLEPVSKDLFPPGLWKDEREPKKMKFIESLSYVEVYKERVFRPKYSIACLIYKSVDWLEFVYKQVLKYTDMKDTEFFFIANDANEEVLKYLSDNHIPHYKFENTPDQKREWYINNVYRAYNYAAKVGKGDFLVLINSDMAFSPGWLEALIAAYDGSNLVSSRLVESGKMGTGKHGIEKNFGRTYSNYKESDFQSYVQSLRKDAVSDGGLFMPLFVNKKHFLKVGGYPEGNIKKGSDIFRVKIAKEGDLLVSGDNVLMQRMATIGIKHQTAMNSIVYHFQCGEKDEQGLNRSVNRKVEIAVCNDIVTGSMGERVLWDYLIDNLPGAFGVDKRIVGNKNFEKRARTYIDQMHPETSIIIQNATFIGTIDSSKHTVAFLQDDLRSMGRQSGQQEANLRLANTRVTNSVQTALAYPEYDFEVIPVGVDSDLFKPRNKHDLRKKYGFGKERIGIFVGSFSEVKGWSKVTRCFKKFPNFTWIAVSKYNENYEAPNVHVFNKVSQEKLSELLNCADFFIIGSPVETQCLAAVEANLCNLPVVMPLVGIYRDFTSEERKRVGLFTDNLEEGVEKIFDLKLKPRDLIIEKGLTIQSSLNKWKSLIEKLTQKINKQTINSSRVKTRNKFLYNKYRLEFIIRRNIFLPIFGKEQLNIDRWFSVSGIKLILYKILLMTHLLGLVKKVFKR